MEGEKKEKEFVVRDRRISSSETSGDSSEPKAKQSEKGPSNAERATESSTEQKRTGPFPELDFSSFIMSLATTAQVSLGNIPNPQTNQPAQNLPVAKQMIDILGMLKGKTKGNLTEDEQLLLDSALFNLRMQYVRAAEGKKAEDKK
jgi:hypothetical protein